MPENYMSLITMVVVLVAVCGAIGVWALRSRRRNTGSVASRPSNEAVTHKGHST
jgi:hypothetical protein